MNSLLSHVLFLATAVHLTLVVLGAASWSPAPSNFLLRVIQYWSNLSGAGSGYGFFAPGVSSQLRASFDIVGKDGAVKVATLERGLSREGDIRIGNIVSHFWRDDKDKKLRRALAASWAGKMFARHPDADEIVVRLESYWLPTSEGYREGARPEWREYYRLRFRRAEPRDT